jgi:hypothetical protein
MYMYLLLKVRSRSTACRVEASEYANAKKVVGDLPIADESRAIGVPTNEPTHDKKESVTHKVPI